MLHGGPEGLTFDTDCLSQSTLKYSQRPHTVAYVHCKQCDNMDIAARNIAES